MYESGYTLFNMMVFGDNSIGEDLDELGKSLGGAMQFVSVIYYLCFAILVVMVLLNFLLAIVVESFVIVKESAKESTSVIEDLHYYFQQYCKTWDNDHLSDEQMLKFLCSMHASEAEILSQNAVSPQKASKPLQDEGNDEEWVDKILILDPKTPSVPAHEVEKQLRISAENLVPDDLIHTSACRNKRNNQVLPDDLTQDGVIQIGDFVPNECASQVARKVMRKFGQEEHEDDVDEDKLAQKKALEEILTSIKLLTAQVANLSKEQQEMKSKLLG